uniref:Uncharacterized protein n=1 Tax=Wuchereria bancrofti TaxID=6293 RepID=A0AAF5RX17_WUCBA
MERMLRQLEATGKNVEQPTIKTIIESKLPNWILNQVYQQKENDYKLEIPLLSKRSSQIKRDQIG